MKELCYQYNVSLKEYCTWGIGGPAKELAVAKSKEELIYLIKQAKESRKRYIVIGKGSNSLFDDRGFNGLVIINKINDIEWRENSVYVGAGYSFSLLGIQASRKKFTGLEFASGIPGSVGGAIYMNAGASGFEVKDILLEVEFLHEEGRIELLKKESLTFSYRKSPFQEMKGVIIAGLFSLTSSREAKEKQEKLLAYRMATQPYKDKSCGCVFRNPEGDSAGRLIDSLGLKGLSFGGAKVSQMHANFIVNDSDASAKEMLDLIAHVQMRVKDELGIVLEPEVKYIPFDDD